MVPFHLFMPDLTTFVVALGYAGIAGVIFAETGLWVGFFLPGDSLLLAAGILASQGAFDMPPSSAIRSATGAEPKQGQ
jgi:membrane protein DedA with SNARE-associated domain